MASLRPVDCRLAVHGDDRDNAHDPGQLMAVDRARVDVLVESGKKKCFARALDWPGWCRAGRTEADALEALEWIRPRYTSVVKRAGLALPDTGVVTVCERSPGTSTTDFGAPGAIGLADARPLQGSELDGWIAMLEAAWDELDDIAAHSSPTLLKGPRGGGRDRLALLTHVLDAQRAYAPKIGVRWKGIDPIDRDAISANRAKVIEALRDASKRPTSTAWPPRYWIHRSAWHILDHAWEMADKQP
jgi:hypothetical protein